MTLPSPRPLPSEHCAEAMCQVQWKYGLHARPSSNVARLAAAYSSSITIQRIDVDIRVSAKSMLGLMTLAAECGSLLAVTATGRDAAEAVEAIRDSFVRSFDMHEWSVPDANGVSVNAATGATYRIR